MMLQAILSKNSHLNTVKKIASYVKLYCVIILIMHILFCHTNQKNVLQKEIDLTSEVYLLIKKISP